MFLLEKMRLPMFSSLFEVRIKNPCWNSYRCSPIWNISNHNSVRADFCLITYGYWAKNFCTGTYTHPCQGYVAFKGAGFNAVHGAAIGISLGMGFCVVRFVLLSHAAKGPCEYKVSWATL